MRKTKTEKEKRGGRIDGARARERVRARERLRARERVRACYTSFFIVPNMETKLLTESRIFLHNG